MSAAASFVAKVTSMCFAPLPSTSWYPPYARAMKNSILMAPPFP